MQEDKRIDVLDHGFVRLVDHMGDDAAIVQAARVSYGAGTKSVSDDEGLIRYLVRHQHTTPLEMCEVKLHCKMPIFVARQWVRHRTANINEYSARYSILSNEFYLPELEQMTPQSAQNKQGRSEAVADEDVGLMLEEVREELKLASEDAYDLYMDLLGESDSAKDCGFPGISRELARIALPVNYYTEWYWKVDLHNLFHFLKLRMDPHAQWEIRVYAEAVAKLVQPLFPIAYRAFEDYRLNAVTFSGPAMKLLRGLLRGSDVDEYDIIGLNKLAEGFGVGKRELDEFKRALEL